MKKLILFLFLIISSIFVKAQINVIIIADSTSIIYYRDSLFIVENSDTIFVLSRDTTNIKILMTDSIKIGGEWFNKDNIGAGLSQDLINALEGTNGEPSENNKFVTNSDSRNSDNRTPISHNHNPSDITGIAIIDNDSRLSDARTPLTHNQNWSTILNTPTTLSGYGITDAMNTSHVVNEITSTNITNWNNSFGWGNHSGLYRLISYVPTWTEITSKPNTIFGYGIIDAQSLNTHLTDLSDGTLTGSKIDINSSTSVGVVSSGFGQNSKVWKTDVSGNPDWRTDETGAGGITWGSITGTLSSQTDLQSSLNGKESTISKNVGYAKWTGSDWDWVNETYSLSTHNHTGIYEPVITAGTTEPFWRGDKTCQTISGGGITTLNTLTALTQIFTTGTNGTDFNISSATATHTFSIPNSSSSARGLLTSTDWTTFSNKASAAHSHLDAEIDNGITLTNITQITNRSHINLSDVGTNTHIQIDNHISSTANPHSTNDANLITSDITTNNVSLTKHGFVPKATGTTTQFLRDDGTWATPSGGGGADPVALLTALRTKPFLYTDFWGAAGAATIEASQGWDYAVISSGTQAKIAGGANHPGILRTSSSTTANSGGYCICEATAFLIAGGETFELIFQHRVASGTNTILRFGFLDNTSSADAVDGCYFEVPATSLAIVGKTSSNSTRSTTSTIYTLTVNTWYRARVVVNSNATSVTFSLYDDAGSLLGEQSLTTNIPIASGRETGAGFVATNSGTTATLLAYWDWMAISYDSRTLVR